MTYESSIMRFFFEQCPRIVTLPEIRFEAVSAAVFGTKQRRFGPLPSPEVQVGVRDVLRQADESGQPLEVFLPWASCKQGAGEQLDLLEFVALTQLADLRVTLAAYGVHTVFRFRLEDHTDRWLFGDDRCRQIDTYANRFERLAYAVLPGARVVGESDMVTWDNFRTEAEAMTIAFRRVLDGVDDPAALEKYGWKGGLPEHQVKYYRGVYKALYPDGNHDEILARFFAAALTRNVLGATAVPKVPHLFVTFAHPVPNDPVRRNRLYYRTLPDRYTHCHKSPWLARGYFEMDDTGACTPRFVTADTPALTANTIEWAGVKIDAPYAHK